MLLVCPDCFVDKSLQRRIEEIRPSYPNNKCSYHRTKKGITLKDVSEIIDGVFRSNFGIGDFFSVPRTNSDKVDHTQSGSSLIDCLYELTGANEQEIIDEISGFLSDAEYFDVRDGGEPFYSYNQYYIQYRSGGYEFGDLWEGFCNSLIHQRRFFNSDARKIIEEIFEKVHLQKDVKLQNPVYQIAPTDSDVTFFRARIADDREKASQILEEPAKNLSSPPARLRKAGRLNPSGVATFYGAFDESTCIAELRPAVGSKVVMGSFKLKRPIYVLDMTRFERPNKELGYFSKDHMRRCKQWQFMKHFMDEIAKPVLPNDTHIDYIPTQAVAEYLAHEYSFYYKNRRKRIEAVIFKSPQSTDGKNIALIGDAALIEPDVNASAMIQMNSLTKTECFSAAIEFVDDSAKVFQVLGTEFSSENISYEFNGDIS